MRRLRIGLRLSQAARVAGTFLVLGFGAAAQQLVAEHPRDQPLFLASVIVAAHNLVRSKIGVPPLVWSKEMATIAQDWANTLLASGAFKHRKENQYGENLLEASGFDPLPSQVVNAWALEAKDYQYLANTCSAVCGHYTQVVWRDTKAVGCGMVRGPTREIWVCDYAPFENLSGRDCTKASKLELKTDLRREFTRDVAKKSDRGFGFRL